jgi:hypothetical protein
MEKKLLLFVVIVLVGLCGSVALALDPMGPPAAALKQGQWSAGIDYSYSDMDLKVDGKYSWYEWGQDPDYYEDWGSGKFKEKAKGVKVNKIYANIGYGIMDNWDAFVRLGGADGDLGAGISDMSGGFDSDYVFAYGFGTRVTLWEQSPEFKVGGLFQMSWANGLNDAVHGTYVESNGSTYVESWAESGKVDITEIQIALGPTWTPAKGFSVYGGPFLHFVSGSFDAKYSYTEGQSDSYVYTEVGKSSGDITEDNCFGGYIGAQVQLGENACVSAEWMTTGDADAFGLGVVCKFK